VAPVTLQAVERPAAVAPGFVPISHLPHPHDPNLRRALCGQEIAGIPASGKYEVCTACLVLEAAGDWAVMRS
jgi:hypothetical protein